MVHFPIALLLLNFALTLAYLYQSDSFLERSAYGALAIGWWGAFAAVATGVLDVTQAWPLRPEVVGWLNAHFALGILLLLVYGRALLLRRRDPAILASARRRGYVALLGLGALLVILSGWTGGRLVYGFGFGVH
jgi:uncharacterized membrane protein